MMVNYNSPIIQNMINTGQFGTQNPLNNNSFNYNPYMEPQPQFMDNQYCNIIPIGQVGYNDQYNQHQRVIMYLLRFNQIMLIHSIIIMIHMVLKDIISNHIIMIIVIKMDMVIIMDIKMVIIITIMEDMVLHKCIKSKQENSRIL